MGFGEDIDFAGLLSEFGGKGAGLKLLQAYDNLYFEHAGRLFIPRFHLIPTSVYATFENILKSEFPNIKDTPIEEFRKNPNFSRELENLVESSLHAFPDAIKYAEEDGYGNGWPFYLRSSATIEDFREDRFYGTFPTAEKEFFFTEKYGKGREHFIHLIVSFYYKKFHQKELFNIGEEELLGMVFMPKLGDTNWHNAIVYSSYPEDPSSPTVIELSSMSEYRTEPEQLVFIDHNNKVEIHQGQAKPSSYSRETIDGQKSGISMRDINLLVTMVKRFEDNLGYSSNLEVVIDEQGIYPVQIRPTPTLSENRPVKELVTLSEDAHLIANTKFVIGSFKITAPLVLAGYKNDYRDHQFAQPVIIWHSEYDKGHRFYYSDKNCVGMFNPNEGVALTHSSTLVPGFGPARDRFAFMGVPGTEELLRTSMIERKEPVGKKEGTFYYTPYNITIESDGRRGRVYINKNDVKHLKQ